MALNSASDIPWLTTLYSGVWRYLSNASSQSAWLNGGIAPAIGRHSTIERPERVSRVTPPTTIIVATNAAQTRSQAITARWDRCRIAAERPGDESGETSAWFIAGDSRIASRWAWTAGPL